MLRSVDLLSTAEIWKKYHTYAILQRAEANLWTKAQYEDWEPCDEVDISDTVSDVALKPDSYQLATQCRDVFLPRVDDTHSCQLELHTCRWTWNDTEATGR
jgi:hypothetical protein